MYGDVMARIEVVHNPTDQLAVTRKSYRLIPLAPRIDILDALSDPFPDSIALIPNYQNAFCAVLNKKSVADHCP